MKSLQLASHFIDLDAILFYLKRFFHEVPETLMYMFEHPYWRLSLVLIGLHISRDILAYIGSLCGNGEFEYYYYDYGFDEEEEEPDPPEIP